MSNLHSKKEMKICTRCILPETFPGIRFDDQGVCRYCRKEEAAAVEASVQKEKYRENFEQLLEEMRGRGPSYDVIMAFSGGKDSTYTLKLLKERYDLRIIAFTFDNHFVSPAAWDNINMITDVLGVDTLHFRLPWDTAKQLFSLTAREDIFSKPTLLRASSICTACIGLVKNLVQKTAIEMSIPLVAFGWSPGQAPIHAAIMKTNPSLFQQTQAALKKAIPADLGKRIYQYFLPENYFKFDKERFPLNIHPLAFFDYDEKIIMKELSDIGWKAPEDTDTNSSNCLINALANQIHIERNGFHPYVWEIANMVRQGVMDREEGIEKIYTAQDPQMVKYARERLGL